MKRYDTGLAVLWARQTFDDTLALIDAAEQFGYDHIWCTNEKFFHDMYVTAAVAARRTRRPTIGTFVSDPYSLHPALTAMAVGTLDEVSGGRAMICMGAGGTGFPEMGIQRRKPARAIREAIEVIRGLLRGERVDFHGEAIAFNNGRLNFDTRPDIPIIVGTRGDLVLQMAGEVADGVLIATYAEPVGLRHALSRVERGAVKAGRTLADLKVISRIDTCIHPDRRAAYAAVKPGVGVVLWSSYPDRKFVERVGLEVPSELETLIAKRDYNLMHENAHLIPDAFVDKFCWAGTVEDVEARIAAVAEVGVRSFTIMPVPGPGGSRVEVARQFAEIVARLNETPARVD